MEFFLHQLKLAYVLTQPCPSIPIEESSSDQVRAINDQIDKWNDDDYFCRNHILSGMTDSFYDQYSKKNYMDFKMTDDRPVSVQVREFQLIANDIRAAGMVLDENFHVGVIVAKLPPTWKEYRNKLKHKKEDLSLDQLMQHLHIEEETRNREKEPAKETIVKAHDLGEADVILGIKIIRSQQGIVLTQSSYIEKILRSCLHYSSSIQMLAYDILGIIHSVGEPT
ncbi:hypothetical protein RJ639_020984 [Escallonia herrerae]|uniref:Uncharacterized protein n=1 Tax=Escallonia herrerae TaxID=1293975 RepID=A0AA88V5B9_9ASTE|nr:hypothetical protein RJ639_020984 [Escallonia herrerae]